MKQIPLTKGKFALVDDEDYEFLMQWKWHFQARGYAVRASERPIQKKIWMHRVINNTPDAMQTDHIDGNRLNNQCVNLRTVNNACNQMNRKKSPNKSSVYKGVCFDVKNKKWEASIKTDGKKISLGRFTSEILAAKAYNASAIKYFGIFSNLNKVA